MPSTDPPSSTPSAPTIPLSFPPPGHLPWRGGDLEGAERDDRKQWVMERKMAAMQDPRLYMVAAGGDEEAELELSAGLPGVRTRGRGVKRVCSF